MCLWHIHKLQTMCIHPQWLFVQNRAQRLVLTFKRMNRTSLDLSIYNLFIWMADHGHAVGIAIEQYSSHSRNSEIKGWMLNVGEALSAERKKKQTTTHCTCNSRPKDCNTSLFNSSVWTKKLVCLHFYTVLQLLSAAVTWDEMAANMPIWQKISHQQQH